MTRIDLPQVNKQEKETQEISDKKELLGKRIEREIFPLFAKKDLGDIFDLVIRPSDQVDGDVPKEWYALVREYKENGQGKTEECQELEKKIEKYENGPKIDIILRFRHDNTHLSVQIASISLNEPGGLELEREKLGEKAEQPISTIEKICNNNKDNYCPRNLDEDVPKVFINFINNSNNESKIFRAEAINKSLGKETLLFDCLNLDYDIKNEMERVKDKKNKDIFLQKYVIEKFIEGLNDTIKQLKENRENEKIEKIDLRMEALRQRRFNSKVETIKFKIEILQKALEAREALIKANNLKSN